MNNFTKLLKQLTCISQSRWYWQFAITGCLFLLSIALYYQHMLDELPCVVCIQVRLLFSLLFVVAVAGLLTRGNRLIHAFINGAVLIIAVFFSERSYLLLGTERGFIFSDCGFDLGLPTWLAIEQWLPWLYRVETSCGYTPEIIFGITMAEALMAMSVVLVLISCCMFIASLFFKKTRL